MSNVIVTGGTGLVGKQLSEALTKQGYGVHILTRHPSKVGEFKWDLAKGYIDEAAFSEVTAIIHLAGAGVAEKRWTDSRKKEIIESRIQSAQLLYNYLSSHTHTVEHFISASAVGYYGDREDELLTEESKAGNGFLAEVCELWEAAADRFASLNIKVSKIRIGIVLSAEGGALQKLDLPIKFGIGAYIGSGKQYVPWIHIGDLVHLFIYLLEKKLEGTFNGCAPGIVTNREMSEAIAEALHRPFIPFPAPAFVLKTLMGEMASMVLMSNNCSAEKIVTAGFVFSFPQLGAALINIYNKG